MSSCSVDEQSAVLALISATEEPWHHTASLIEEVGTATGILKGNVSGLESDDDRRQVKELAAAVEPDATERYRQLVDAAAQRHVRLLTVLDPEYPSNLRRIYNRPPFIFIRGELLERDQRAVAVVGTRGASEYGLRRARKLAALLVQNDVTVLSGLATGIDTAAHQAALDAGGRTVAVLGTGINRIYPAENRELADRIVEAGALLSQFWPEAPPTRQSFPMRNVVLSGMAIGTAVIEAGLKSGAKMQARLALEHGKRLFLMRSLVDQEEWAQKYAAHPGATVVQQVEDILEVLEFTARRPRALSLG